MPDKLDTVVFYVWSCGRDLIWNFASAGRATLCSLQFNGPIDKLNTGCIIFTLFWIGSVGPFNWQFYIYQIFKLVWPSHWLSSRRPLCFSVSKSKLSSMFGKGFLSDFGKQFEEWNKVVTGCKSVDEICSTESLDGNAQNSTEWSKSETMDENMQNSTENSKSL